MQVTITRLSVIKTCTEGIFRHSFQVFPKPDEEFMRYLTETRRATLHTIGPSVFFCLDISPGSTIKGVRDDPIVIVTTSLPEEEIRNSIASLYADYNKKEI